MKPAISLGEGDALFAQAASRLRPEIFSHPVWVRFGKAQVPAPRKTIDELLRAAAQLQDNDPGSACQLLLIGAVNQNYAGWRDEALRTTQQALALAERKSLAREILWATWGASAICFQGGHYDQTAVYLAYLQAGLNDQNEWILADFVEVVRQALLQPEGCAAGETLGAQPQQTRGDLLSLTFGRLQQWGIAPAATFIGEAGVPRALPRESWTQPEPRSARGRGTWGSLVLAIKGELNMHWGERHPGRTEPRFTRLRSLFSRDRAQHPAQVIAPSAPEPHPQLPEVSAHASISGEPSPLPFPKPEPLPGITAVVQMLGPFSLTIQGAPLKLPISRGSSLLKYLLLHHKHVTPREILMDIFWPEADPDAARNNLNVAMHGLRQALRSVTDVALIRFVDGGHGLATDLEIWLDVDEFERCTREGQRLEAREELNAAVIEYEIAVDLYRGDFLADSPYDGWTTQDRERLRVAYLDTLERLGRIYFGQGRYAACVALCQLLLSRDPCREDAHCRLMQCYSRLGQSPLALRQYQICAAALRAELQAQPAPETKQLYSRIRRHEQV